MQQPWTTPRNWLIDRIRGEPGNINSFCSGVGVHAGLGATVRVRAAGVADGAGRPVGRLELRMTTVPEIRSATMAKIAAATVLVLVDMAMILQVTRTPDRAVVPTADTPVPGMAPPPIPASATLPSAATSPFGAASTACRVSNV